MKWMIYALLLANLAVFAWSFRPAQQSAVQPVPTASSDVPTLVLLNEPGDRQSKPAAVVTPDVEPETIPAVEPKPLCWGLGPFDKRAESRAAAGLLSKQGVAASVDVVRLPDLPGHWVVLPPFPTRKAARQAIAKLKAIGIEDYFLVATGEMKNAVSLGVFSRPDTAARRVRELERHGITPQVDSVPLPQREYWLDLGAAETDVETVERALGLLAADYPEVDWLQHPCAE